jgi:hypothetical protein
LPSMGQSDAATHSCVPTLATKFDTIVLRGPATQHRQGITGRSD